MYKISLGLVIVGIGLLGFAYTGLSSYTVSRFDKVEVESNRQESKINNKTSRVLKELSLSGSRQVYITGEIDENNSPRIASDILDLGKSDQPMTIIINSPGGSVFDGALIVSAIEAARGPVNTLCVQLCASMAAMIHQYGTKRLMLDRSVLMFHPASGGISGSINQIHSRLSMFERFIGKMEMNVARRSGISLEAYRAKSAPELWIDAEDSVANHYADSVVYVRGREADKLYRGSYSMSRSQATDPKKNPVPKLDRFE